MQREVKKKYKGRPLTDDDSRQNWDNFEIFGLFNNIIEGNWRDKPKFKDFKVIVKLARIKVRINKRAKVDPKKNLKIYNLSLNKSEEEDNGNYRSNIDRFEAWE